MSSTNFKKAYNELHLMMGSALILLEEDTGSSTPKNTDSLYSLQLAGQSLVYLDFLGSVLESNLSDTDKLAVITKEYNRLQGKFESDKENVE